MKRILYLVKIGKLEHLERTVYSGQFFMNTCEYFRTRAIEDGGDLVGDLQECSFPQGTGVTIGDVTLEPFDKEDPSSSAMCCAANYCIYCTYAVLNNEDGDEDVIHASVFKGIVGNEDPSQYGVLVFKKPTYVIDKIARTLSGRGLIGRCDLVQYDDHTFVSSYRFGTKEYILDLCFHKRSDFKEQNEYRIATINSTNAPIEDLFIGPLKDYDFSLFPIQAGKSLYISTRNSKVGLSYRWDT